MGPFKQKIKHFLYKKIVLTEKPSSVQSENLIK